MQRFIVLGIHKTYVYAYERNEDGSGRGFWFLNTPEGWVKFCAGLDGNAL